MVNLDVYTFQMVYEVKMMQLIFPKIHFGDAKEMDFLRSRCFQYLQGPYFHKLWHDARTYLLEGH